MDNWTTPPPRRGPAQTLDPGGELAAGHYDFTFSDVSFTKTEIDECVDVTDTFDGGAAETLGTVCVSGYANPTYFRYSRTIAIPAYGCLSYLNTATFVTNDTGATGSDSVTVQVCRKPPVTGARTMGFWQNKTASRSSGATRPEAAATCRGSTPSRI